MSLESIKIATIPVIITFCISVMGATFVVRDRVEKSAKEREVLAEARATEKATLTAKLARYDERLKSLEEGIRETKASIEKLQP